MSDDIVTGGFLRTPPEIIPKMCFVESCYMEKGSNSHDSWSGQSLVEHFGGELCWEASSTSTVSRDAKRDPSSQIYHRLYFFF